MNASNAIIVPSKMFLSGWECALLVLPALAGLVLGFLLAFLPGLFAAITQFPADDAYIYLLAGGILLLPWIIAPVGLIVMVVCLIVLRQTMSRRDGITVLLRRGL